RHIDTRQGTSQRIGQIEHQRTPVVMPGKTALHGIALPAKVLDVKRKAPGTLESIARSTRTDTLRCRASAQQQHHQPRTPPCPAAPEPHCHHCRVTPNRSSVFSRVSFSGSCALPSRQIFLASSERLLTHKASPRWAATSALGNCW